jgi:hypothetical protein
VEGRGRITGAVAPYAKGDRLSHATRGHEASSRHIKKRGNLLLEFLNQRALAVDIGLQGLHRVSARALISVIAEPRGDGLDLLGRMRRPSSSEMAAGQSQARAFVGIAHRPHHAASQCVQQPLVSQSQYLFWLFQLN